MCSGINSGAQVSVISTETWKKLESPTDLVIDNHIKMPKKCGINSVKRLETIIKFPTILDNIQFEKKYYVVKGNKRLNII